MRRRSGAGVLAALLWTAAGPAAPEALEAQEWEVVGGTLGSAVGFGAGLVVTATGDAGIRELGRNLVVGSALGAAGGAYLAGRLAGDGPSWWGAAVGAAVGTVVAVGVASSLDDALRGEPSGVIYLGYTVSQGALAGIGAWLPGRGGGEAGEDGRAPRPF